MNSIAHCTFCGKPDDSVEVMIAGPWVGQPLARRSWQVMICNECVALCAYIVTDQRAKLLAEFSAYHAAIGAALG